MPHFDNPHVIEYADGHDRTKPLHEYAWTELCDILTSDIEQFTDMHYFGNRSLTNDAIDKLAEFRVLVRMIEIDNCESCPSCAVHDLSTLQGRAASKCSACSSYYPIQHDLADTDCPVCDPVK